MTLTTELAWRVLPEALRWAAARCQHCKFGPSDDVTLCSEHEQFLAGVEASGFTDSTGVFHQWESLTWQAMP